MKMQMLKMIHNGEYKVIYDTEKAINPYAVYHIWREPTEYGLSTHKKMVQKYGDFASCLYFLIDIVNK